MFERQSGNFNRFQLQLTDKYQDEEHVLYVMTAADLNDYVKSKCLAKHIVTIQSQCAKKYLTLLVFGVKEFCRTNRNAGRLAIETALTEIQLCDVINVLICSYSMYFNTFRHFVNT